MARTPEHERQHMEREWEHIQHLDREAEEKRYAVLQRDAERERLMWLSMPGNDHPTYYSDSDADGEQSDRRSPSPSVAAAASAPENDPYLHYAADQLRRQDPSASSFRPIPAPGPAQRYRHHPVLAAEEDEQTRVLVAQQILHGNRTGNRGNKLRRKEGVRYASRGKLSTWSDGKFEKEMSDSVKQRTKAIQRASIRSLLDSAPALTPSPPLRPQELPEDWPEPQESNLRGDNGEAPNGAGPSSDRDARRGKASIQASTNIDATKVKREAEDESTMLATSLEVYPWLRSSSLGKMAGPYLEDYPPDHDPSVRASRFQETIPDGQRRRKRRLLQAAIAAAAPTDNELDPNIVAELAEAFAPAHQSDPGPRSAHFDTPLHASRSASTGANNLSSTSLAPTLLRPVLTPLALLESQTLRHTFRNPHIGALSNTALDLIESESVVSRALGRCFAAIESGGMPGWGAYLEAEERARKRRKVDEARAQDLRSKSKAKGSASKDGGTHKNGPEGERSTSIPAMRPAQEDNGGSSNPTAQRHHISAATDGSAAGNNDSMVAEANKDADVSMQDASSSALKQEPAATTAQSDHGDPDARDGAHAGTTGAPYGSHLGVHNGSRMQPVEVDAPLRETEAGAGLANFGPVPAVPPLSDFGPALTQLEHLFITPGGMDMQLHVSPLPEGGAAGADAAAQADSMSTLAGDATLGSDHPTTALDVGQQRALVRASLECLYELAQDSREYIERLQEVREKLAQVRLGRARIWGAVRGWALGEVEDELARRRVERVQEEQGRRERGRERGRERAAHQQRAKHVEASSEPNAGPSSSSSLASRHHDERDG